MKNEKKYYEIAAQYWADMLKRKNPRDGLIETGNSQVDINIAMVYAMGIKSISYDEEQINAFEKRLAEEIKNYVDHSQHGVNLYVDYSPEGILRKVSDEVGLDRYLSFPIKSRMSIDKYMGEITVSRENGYRAVIFKGEI